VSLLEFSASAIGHQKWRKRFARYRGKVAARGRTETDCTVLFEGLAPGSYMARLAIAR